MDVTTILIPIIAVVFVAAILYFISIYNRLYSLRNSAEATLGQIRVALKKRLDMIEQLVDVVKSYAKFEKETLERITSLRTEVFKAGAAGLGDIDRESRMILNGVVAVAENYPTLRASEPAQKLMEAIRDVEDEIARQRYTYNNITQEFNTMLDTIPSKFVASWRRMVKLEYLKFEEEVEKRPETKL